MLSQPARSLLLGFATLAACGGGSATDIQELKKGQKDILAKLEGLENSVKQIRAQPAAQARPQIDPSKAYTIPIANSAVRGPKTARVSIVEFSDFQ
jgi:protein-disulfide isomerase